MAEKTARMSQLEALLADDPNDSFLRYGLAMEYVSQGDDETAVAQFRELIEKSDPPYVPAYLQAGQILSRLGREDEAKAIFRTGIEQAQKQGNDHAAGEMTGFLEAIE